MPDEKGTEATRSDAPNARDVLFEDGAVDANTKEHEAKDTNGEAEKDRREPEAGEEKADDHGTGPQADLKGWCPSKETGPLSE